MFSRSSDNTKGNRGNRALALIVAAALGLANTLAPEPANAAERFLKVPTGIKKRTVTKTRTYHDPDLLLIMPYASAEQENIDKAFKEVDGQVVGSMGEGQLKCLIVKTPKGKLDEVETKLRKEKKTFRCISRNYRFKAHFVPNDADFPSQWHLAAMNCPKAWDTVQGNGTKVAVFDTGCQANIPDLNGKTDKGYDATTFGARMTVLAGPGLLGDIAGAVGGAASSGAQTDVHGHGTWVATAAAATANNSSNTAGVAPKSRVYPVQIAGSGGTTDDIAIMAGLLNMFTTGNRIVNISYGAPPPVGFTNVSLHGPLHVYMQSYYAKGGLIFLSSGNDSMFDPNPPTPYYNVVTAIDSSMTLADFSNWGNSTTFTAPGKGIMVSDRDGSTISVNGTSFSAPIVAATAALIWNANPALPNTWVEHILKASCLKTNGGALWTPYYGYGMPDAKLAVKLAKGGL